MTFDISASALSIVIRDAEPTSLGTKASEVSFPVAHVLSIRDFSGASTDTRSRSGPERRMKATVSVSDDTRRRVFWNVEDPAHAVVLQLRNELYDELIVEVADPGEVVRRIRRRLAA